MKSQPRFFYARYGFAILVLVAALTPLLFDAAFRAVRSNSNKVLDWLPSSFTETADLRWFRQHFAGDGFVVISWDGCQLGGDPSDPHAAPDDPRIERVARALVPDASHVSHATGTADEAAEPRYFSAVTTGRQLLTQLTSPPTDLAYAASVNRLKGILIGPEGRQTCLVATLTQEGINNFRGVLGRGVGGALRFRHREGSLFATLRACGVASDTVHLGGPPVDNVAIDEEGERTLVRLGGLAGIVGFVLAAGALRSVKLTLIVLTCGLLSAAASLAAVWLSGATTDAVLMSMPALVYVLAISGAVHLVNYYRTEVEERGLRGAPERAIAHGWRPALFCSVTTAMGLLSLYASDLTPIRKFGAFSALGVMLMLVVLFVFLPAALQRWPIARYRHSLARDSQGPSMPHAAPGAGSGEPELAWGSKFWAAFAGWITQWHVAVTTVCLTLILIVGLGVLRLQTTIDLMKLFDREARILHDYRWLESRVGRLVPMELVLRFDSQALRRKGSTADTAQRLSLIQRMEIVAEVQRTIAARFGPRADDVVGPSMSALTLVPSLPAHRGGTSSIVRRTATNSQLQQSYDSLLQSGYLRIDPVDGAELWRVSLRLAAFRDVDYAQFSSDLRRVVDPVVAKYNDDGVSHPFHPGQRQSTKVGERPRLTAVYTGVVPIVYKAQRALLDSLMQSTFWSFATITPLLMFVSRGARAGVVAMLPNVLPVLVVFGGMGWLRLPVDIGSMMSASIALGVAVDDTIHFLTWFREDLKHSGDRRAAILNAYQRCATPTLQAALISGVGLSVFAFSTFTPTKQFGVMMLTILLAGVVAELVMLPALLAGPLGRVFTPTWRRQHADRDRSDVPPPFHLSQEKRPCLELDTPNCS